MTAWDGPAPLVLLTEDIDAAGRRLLLDAGAQVRVAAGLDPGTLRRELADADAVILRARGRLDADALAAAPRLRVVARYGVGVDNVDVAAATRLGVTVVNAPGASADSVAEHGVACLLALARDLAGQDHAVRTGDWAYRDRVPGRELRGALLGVVGLGEIGLRLARICRHGLGMRVAYADPVPRPEAEHELGATRLDLDELLRSADAVSVHVPLTPATHGLIDAAALRCLKPSAFLLNLARGGVVDEPALAAALRAGELAGAAVDVFTEEPPRPDHPLMHCPRVLLTPHSGALTVEASRRVAEMVATDVLRVLHDQPARNPVRPAADPGQMVHSPGSAAQTVHSPRATPRRSAAC